MEGFYESLFRTGLDGERTAPNKLSATDKIPHFNFMTKEATESDSVLTTESLKKQARTSKWAANGDISENAPEQDKMNAFIYPHLVEQGKNLSNNAYGYAGVLGIQQREMQEQQRISELAKLAKKMKEQEQQEQKGMFNNKKNILNNKWNLG